MKFIFAFLVFASLLSCNRPPRVDMPNTIVVGSSADAKRLLPMLATDSTSATISGWIFNGLTKYDRNLNIVGDLAKSWEIKDGGLVIIFHLRKNVRWQDGVPFTADDVVFTYQEVTNPKVPTPYSSDYGPVKSVVALGPYTVKVTYKAPYAPALGAWGMGIIPKHILEGKDLSSSYYSRHPVGTGPYKLKEWVTGQRIVLEANPDYFEGRPNIDQYIMRIIPDDATAFLELKFGGIDYKGLTPAQYKNQAGTPIFRKYFQKFRYPAMGYDYLGWNLLKNRFRDVRVRRALAHAIDKQSIIKGALMGYGTPCTGPFLPGSWAYNENVKDPDYNPQRALELFKEAGWTLKNGVMEKKGNPFRFTILLAEGDPRRSMAAQIIQEELRKIGVRVQIQTLEWQAFLHQYVDKKRFDAVLLGWELSPDPDLYDIFYSKKTKPGEFNFLSYGNPEVDKLLIEGRSTFNMKKRQADYHRIHALLANDQPCCFLYVADALPVLNKRFKGVKEAPIGIWYNFIKWRVPADKNLWYN
ncbi:MAG: peptide-binding protein [Actinomycetota bacterium]|nr:peptide-binding protein [Actinomycetota bacterium]